MIYNNLFLKKFNNKEYFRNTLFLFCIISFFFLWDIKLDLFKNYAISFREFFYLIIFYFFFDFKKKDKKFLIKFFIFFIFFLFFNLFMFDVSFENLNIRQNILSIPFLAIIFLICFFYKKNIINSLHSAFLVFIYIFAFSFFFSDIYYLSLNEKIRICGFLNFKIINHHIFLESSHLGMVLVPFYYYIFKENKINFYQKIFLLIFLSFIFIFYYSVTLLFSVIISFFLMLIIDYRFFLKNKLFFLLQLMILITPIFQSNCVFKVNNAITNLPNISHSTEMSETLKSEIETSIFIKKSQIKIEKNFDDISKQLENIEIVMIRILNQINQMKLSGLVNSKRETKENKKIYQELSKEYSKLKKLKEKLTKLKLYNQIPFFSAAEMNYLIKENVDDFPLLKNSKINDHSSAVLINAINVAYLSIKDKPLGWGINNYQSAFNKYMLGYITPPFLEIYYLNYNDASNNFIKLIVEFGCFSIIIFINLIIFTLNKNIPISQRILIAGIIATQMARAAGYFNGGFILCLAITFVMNYQTLKNHEK